MRREPGYGAGLGGEGPGTESGGASGLVSGRKGRDEGARLLCREKWARFQGVE
jgi:hypothetical protein